MCWENAKKIVQILELYDSLFHLVLLYSLYIPLENYTNAYCLKLWYWQHVWHVWYFLSDSTFDIVNLFGIYLCQIICTPGIFHWWFRTSVYYNCTVHAHARQVCSPFWSHKYQMIYSISKSAVVAQAVQVLFPKTYWCCDWKLEIYSVDVSELEQPLKLRGYNLQRVANLANDALVIILIFDNVHQRRWWTDSWGNHFRLWLYKCSGLSCKGILNLVNWCHKRKRYWEIQLWIKSYILI